LACEGEQPDGVRLEDFGKALAAMHQSEFGMNHFDELKEFIEGEKIEVLGISPCRTQEESTVAPASVVETPKVVAVAMPSNGGKRNYDA
jgi:hypothetical protein